MTLYRIEEGRKATHICIEAEIVNHTDWAALHILHTKAEALKTVEWYMDNAGYSWIGMNCRRYGWTVNSDCSICYHIPGEGWTCLSEGEAVKMSDLRKADAIQASGADDEMAWAADPERVTVYIMDEDMLRVDIDAGELADDCEAVNVSDMEERTADELNIIRIQPTAQTAQQTAERCAHYTRHALRRFPELAEKVISAIADPANDGRWTDADSVKDIVWPICNAIENPAQQPQEAPQEAPAAEAEQQPTPTENAPQAATQAAEVDAITYTTDEDPTPAPGLLIHRPGSARGIIIGDGVMLPDDPTDLLTAYGEREYSRDAAGNYIIPA